MKILDANRLFPADGEARSVAARLYETVKDLPLISPHGHTDPRWFAFNEPFDLLEHAERVETLCPTAVEAQNPAHRAGAS